MGNAGALTLAAPVDGTAVLVFADNLTALDLGACVRSTCAGGRPDARGARGVVPAAVRRGRRSRGGRYWLPGEAVDRRTGGQRDRAVGPRALAVLADLERPVGIVDLVRGAVAAGLAVRAEPHSAPWVDVNDAESRQRAEALVQATPAAFGYVDPSSTAPDPPSTASYPRVDRFYFRKRGPWGKSDNLFVFLEGKLSKPILDAFKKARGELNIFELPKEKKDRFDSFLLANAFEKKIS